MDAGILAMGILVLLVSFFLITYAGIRTMFPALSKVGLALIPLGIILLIMGIAGGT